MSEGVLIVDDEFGLADLVAELLGEAGYSVRVAINGRAGLARLEELRPQLVILDVMMPLMDGPTLLRTMRADARWAQIPVIMVTALPEALPPEIPPLYQAVMFKPFSPETLFSTVRAVLDAVAS